MTPNPLPLYRLSYIGLARAALAPLANKAKQLGIGADLASALRHMEQRLSADAREVGESRETYDSLGLEDRLAFFSHFYVRFAVDAVRRVVYVYDFGGSGPLR
jgi:hypothetical protein